MSQFLKSGGEILACGTCLKIRDREGSEMYLLSTMEDLYNIIYKYYIVSEHPTYLQRHINDHLAYHPLNVDTAHQNIKRLRLYTQSFLPTAQFLICLHLNHSLSDHYLF